MAENRFRGTSDHVMDDKGRLNLPSRFRDVMHLSGTDLLLVAPWIDHLRAYRLPEWEDLETKLLSRGAEQGIRKFVRYAMGRVVECVVDKQGRIRIPPELRAEIGLDKEVTLIGMADWFEIQDKSVAKEELDTTRNDYPQIKDGLANIGIF